MAIARAKGKLRGKSPKLSDKQQKELRRMHETGDYSISDLAEVFTVSRPTVYRTLGRQSPPHNDQIKGACPLIEEPRPFRSTSRKRRECEGFRMPALCRGLPSGRDGAGVRNLQGRKPRVGRAPIRRTRYGDLRVASVCWRVVAMTIKDDFEG